MLFVEVLTASSKNWMNHHSILGKPMTSAWTFGRKLAASLALGSGSDDLIELSLSFVAANVPLKGQLDGLDDRVELAG
ncbi:MAG: hypothetical protein KF760_25350 [Candidatus Eremiobacteraeota bacterium]|nr:hypothetical protein [Candidatus Eremiobacteraeota bacterium]MCW5871452.1 hypothetical protein [Candidatus Eremiobacteraeota bacterium]